MSLLSRIFRRTPSLRTRVALATAIGAAIVVVIVGTVVWIGITNDRKERLDRRLDEAAGFAIPFLPRGLDEIPKSPNNQDAVITVRTRRRGDVQLRRRAAPAGPRLCRHQRRRGALPGAHGRHPVLPRTDVGGRRRDLRRDHRRHQQPASPRAHHLRVRRRGGDGVRLGAGRVRGPAAQTAGPADPADRRRRRGTRRRGTRRHGGRRDRRGGARAWWSASGRSRTAPRRR